MLLVRQPIPLVMRIALGILSVALLIGWYTFVSNSLHHQARAAERARLPPVQEELRQVEARVALIREAQTPAGLTPDGPSETGADGSSGDSTSDLQALEDQRATLRKRIEAIELDIQSAHDPAVPTWRELYEDGWKRVTTGQSLSKDEYWLWEDATATAWRLVAGLATGVFLSVALGILMGSYSPIEAFFVPPLSFLAKIPPTAMLAVFFVFVGTTFKMYVAMIAFGTLPTLAQIVYQSAKKDVPEALVNKAYTLGASHAELIWNVVYRQILPRTIDAARLQIGPAMVLLVAAEWMVASEGFGYRLRLSYQLVDMAIVFVYLCILATAGLITDYALIWFRRLLCPWFGE